MKPVKEDGISSLIIVFYDEECALCNASVRFIIKHDKDDMFHFAPLGSKLASTLLSGAARKGVLPDSVVLWEMGEVYTLSDAVVRILEVIEGKNWIFHLFRLLPRKLRDAIYKVIAAARGLLKKKKARCYLPPPDKKHLFLTDLDMFKTGRIRPLT